MTLPNVINGKTAYTILRVVLGLIFVAHGAARLIYASVIDFGGYLNAQGFLIGVPLAWIITLGEIISGCLLATGIKVKYCVIFHAVIILTGIALVHIPNGWFVVGHGRNGVEYSVLILAVLVLIYSFADADGSTFQTKNIN